MRSGTPTPSASSSTPARRRRPTWASCATSKPTKRCTTRRRFTPSAAVLSQVTGAAPTTAYTLSSLAAAIWLFPVSAATLTWQSAAHPHRRVAHRRRGGDRGRAVGVVHRDPLRRVRHRLDAQPRRLRPGRADHGAGRVRAAAPRPHPACGAGAARGVLRAHHRRRGDRAVRGGVVAVRRAVAARARPRRRFRQPAADRDSRLWRCCFRSSSGCCSRPRSSSGTRSSRTRARSAA